MWKCTQSVIGVYWDREASNSQGMYPEEMILEMNFK